VGSKGFILPPGFNYDVFGRLKIGNYAGFRITGGAFTPNKE
jgi:hypothetical protein